MGARLKLFVIQSLGFRIKVSHWHVRPGTLCTFSTITKKRSSPSVTRSSNSRSVTNNDGHKIHTHTQTIESTAYLCARFQQVSVAIALLCKMSQRDGLGEQFCAHTMSLWTYTWPWAHQSPLALLSPSIGMGLSLMACCWPVFMGCSRAFNDMYKSRESCTAPGHPTQSTCLHLEWITHKM